MFNTLSTNSEHEFDYKEKDWGEFKKYFRIRFWGKHTDGVEEWLNIYCLFWYQRRIFRIFGFINKFVEFARREPDFVICGFWTTGEWSRPLDESFNENFPN